MNLYVYSNEGIGETFYIRVLANAAKEAESAIKISVPYYAQRNLQLVNIGKDIDLSAPFVVAFYERSHRRM